MSRDLGIMSGRAGLRGISTNASATRAPSRDFNSLLSRGVSPAAAKSPPALAVAGAPYDHRAFLWRSRLLQALIDIGALAFLILFFSLVAIVIGGAPLILLLVTVL